MPASFFDTNALLYVADGLAVHLHADAAWPGDRGQALLPGGDERRSDRQLRVGPAGSRVRLTLLLRVTSTIAVLGAALFFVTAASGMLNLATVLGPMILFPVGVGASGPVAITGPTPR